MPKLIGNIGGRSISAAAARVPVRLTVGSSNDPSLRLYLRLGFVPTGAVPMYIEMSWTPSETT